MKRSLIFLLSFCSIILCSCISSEAKKEKPIEVGAKQFKEYLHLLKNKNVGLVANHTTVVDTTHLLDTLLSYDVAIKKIFSPEHGFRGNKEAGKKISNMVDEKTGIPIISLYGNNYKPKSKDLEEIDIIIFDIQDVGVRFYTYISTMHYVMEACAENGIPVIILDRPNPNGHYISGPVLDTAYSSFVGKHPVPLVHGLTVGELAQMINGEKWISKECDLTIINCKNYTHSKKFELPINPSPNLPNMQSVYLYPSLGLFEGTVISVGRGTDFPFQVYGHPSFDSTLFTFTPRPITGASNNPKFKHQKCYGYDLRKIDVSNGFTLSFLINAYKKCPKNEQFFNPFFEKLTGNQLLQEMIEKGKTEDEIFASWKDDLEQYKLLRKKYLLYKDF